MTVSFALSRDIIAAFPEVQIRFVAAHGLRNTAEWREAAARLRALEDLVAAGRWRPFDETNAEVASWHEAFRRFGTNPRRTRPSADLLGRRLLRTGTLPRINGAVDAYNYVSVRYGTPAGAFNLDRLDGAVEIRYARNGDVFTPLGEPERRETPNDGEVVYAAGSHVLTRHWNHRDCDLTKVDVNCTAAVFIIERISAQAVETKALAAAQRELAELVRPHAADVVLAVIEAETPVTQLVADEPGLAI